jgi:CDP-glucose 4,6-dehydratase
LFEVIPPPVFHEAGLLKLNCDKALQMLNWKPVMNFDETIRFTSLWYKTASQESEGLYKYTVDQINEYIFLAKERNLAWCSN